MLRYAAHVTHFRVAYPSNPATRISLVIDLTSDWLITLRHLETQNPCENGTAGRLGLLSGKTGSGKNPDNITIDV